MAVTAQRRSKNMPQHICTDKLDVTGSVVVQGSIDCGSLYVGGTRVIRGSAAPTSDATAGARTWTIAELLTGTLVRDCAGASRSDVLPTAALLVAGVSGAAVGDIIEFLYINGSDPVTEIITITAGTGGAFDTNQTAVSRTILGTCSKLVRIRITNVTASSEAYVVYA